MVFSLVDIDETVVDPAQWGKNFPRQYDGYIRTVEHPAAGELPIVGFPWKFSATPAEPGAAAPELGQHTEEILLDAGYSWDDIAALRESGAI